MIKEYIEKPVLNCINCTCRSTLFNLLSNEELRLVDQNRINVVFKPGETIRKQGTYMSHVISLNGGMAKLYLEGLEKRNVILQLVKPTNFIGGSGIYLDQMHHFTISALLESSVCFIDVNVFKKLIMKNQEFAEEFLKDFSRNMLSVYGKLISLTQKQMHGRLADALLYLFNEIYENHHIPMLITKQELADLSAMSRESVLKILREFQHDGIITYTDHEMELLNLDGLKKISKIG